MEINNLPPPTALPSLRAPSAVSDGDAGPNSPYFRHRKQQKRTDKGGQTKDQTPGLEASTSHIDIRV